MIEKVTSREEALKEANVVDYGDLCLMQGLVDSHVHVNEPGRGIMSLPKPLSLLFVFQ